VAALAAKVGWDSEPRYILGSSIPCIADRPAIVCSFAKPTLSSFQRIRAGGAGCLDRNLIARFEGRLLAFVEVRLRDRAASEDVVQEAFVGFLTKSAQLTNESRPLEGYLFFGSRATS